MQLIFQEGQVESVGKKEQASRKPKGRMIKLWSIAMCRSQCILVFSRENVMIQGRKLKPSKIKRGRADKIAMLQDQHNST